MLKMDFKEVLEGLEESDEIVEAAAKAAMVEALKHIQELADQWVPEDTGHLRRSWKINEPVVRGSIIEGSIEYTADYAAIVHEMPQEGINWTRPGSGPKWLERAFDQGSAEASRILGQVLGSALEGGRVPSANTSGLSGPEAK